MRVQDTPLKHKFAEILFCLTTAPGQIKEKWIRQGEKRETSKAQQSGVQCVGLRALCSHPLLLGLPLHHFRSFHTLLCHIHDHSSQTVNLFRSFHTLLCHIPCPGTPRKSVDRLLPFLTLVSNNAHVVEITPGLGISCSWFSD